MDKDALLHRPIESEIGRNYNIAARQKERDELDSQVNEFLRNGGSIERIEFGVVADYDNSVAAANARTWYLENPDVVPVQGGVHITDAMLQYANKRLAQKGGIQAPNMSQVAKELGVNEVALRKEVHKHRARISARNGSKNSNGKTGRKKS